VLGPAGERNRGISPRALSRIGGALYLTIIAIGAFGEIGIRNRIVVPGDATATAANLSALVDSSGDNGHSKRLV
jgi:hypothetical protein